MSRLKGVSALTALATVLVGVTACSGNPNPEGTGGGTDGAEITWWATQQSGTIEDDEKFWQPIVDEFTSQTGIKVNFEVNPFAGYYNRILGAISSGSGPDVVNIGTTWTGPLSASGAFVQFDDANMQTVGGRDKFVESSLAAAGGDMDGGSSFLPLMSQAYTLWYNTKMFADAGIDGPPADFDDFVEDAKRLTQDTDGDGQIDQYGFGWLSGDGPNMSHMIWAYGRQNGSDIYASDGTPTLDSPGVVDAFKTFSDLMTVDGVLSTTDVETKNTAQEFQGMASGRVAMVIGTNPIPVFNSTGFTDFANAQAPLFSPLSGDPIVGQVAGANVGVLDSSQNKDAALKFLEYLTSEEVQVQLANDLRVLPVNQEALLSPDVTKDDIYNQQAEALQNHTASWPTNASSAQAELAMGNALVQLMSSAALNGPHTESQIREALSEANAQLLAAG